MSLPKVLRADAGKLCRGKTSARGAAVVAFASDGVREVLLDATHVRWWRAGWWHHFRSSDVKNHVVVVWPSDLQNGLRSNRRHEQPNPVPHDAWHLQPFVAYS